MSKNATCCSKVSGGCSTNDIKNRRTKKHKQPVL